jgi:UDPglucose--hexose-1-phosphate uridylyltransferase
MGDDRDHLSELRTDPLTGVQVQVTGSRQKRPNLPTTGPAGCPFCVGGTEAPEPYRVRAFRNRWPSFPDDRCEVVLYAPDHDSRLSTMAPDHVRKVVDLWAERTEALGVPPRPRLRAGVREQRRRRGRHHPPPARPDLQLPRRARRCRPPSWPGWPTGTALLEDDPELVVVERDGWRAWVPSAPIYPYGLRVAPLDQRPDLPSLDPPTSATPSARCSPRRSGGWRAVFDPPMPYIFWIHQRPFDGGRLAAGVAARGDRRTAPGPRRDALRGRGRAGQRAYLNPVVPEDAAANLRAAPRVTRRRRLVNAPRCGVVARAGST